jgi:hypothetical protein
MASLMGGMVAVPLVRIFSSLFQGGGVVAIVGSVIVLTGPIFLLGLYLFNLL